MPKLSFTFFKKLPEREKKITISTLFTLIRIFLVPFIVIAMCKGSWFVALLLFSFAAITDTIDGSLARLLNEKTFLGACLDPIADKILLLSCFFTLACIRLPIGEFPGWLVMVLFLKECIILGGAIIIFAIKGHIHIQPTLLGKVTTVLQMLFIAGLFTAYVMRCFSFNLYYAVLGTLLGVVFCSLIQYTRIGLEQLFNREYL